MKDTFDYNGKKIPLTKDGFPSKVHMAKEDRHLVDQGRAAVKGMNTQNRQDELKKFLEALKNKKKK